jgi:hypothetical protein
MTASFWLCEEDDEYFQAPMDLKVSSIAFIFMGVTEPTLHAAERKNKLRASLHISLLN